MNELNLETLNWSLLDDFDREMRQWSDDEPHDIGARYGEAWDADISPANFNYETNGEV
jgi:hypothetical protein